MRLKSLREILPGFARILVHLWPSMRKQKAMIVWSFVALFAEIGLRLLEPWPLKIVFDNVITTQPQTALSGFPLLDSLDVGTLLLVCAVGVVAITALRAVAAYFNTVGFAMVGNKVLAELRGKVYAHLQRLSLSFHSRARSGDLVVRVIGDVSQLKDVAVTALLPMMANVLVLVGMIALMMWLNWQLAVLALVTVPLFWLSTVRLSRRIQEAARNQRKREGAMASTATETISAIKIVQALSLEETLAAGFFSQNKKSLKQDVKATKLSASLERTVDVLIAISTGLVLWYGSQLVLSNRLTPGDLLVFLTYLKNGFKPVRDFAKYTGRLAKATAAGERVLDLLDREPDVRNLPGAVPAPALQGAVAFRNVGFEYEPGRPVLHDIDLVVQPGKHVALVGSSGNGKSTLVSLVLRLYDPTSGSVLIDGRDVREYTIESLRTQVSVVMQDTILFAASVRDNIAYGAPDATDEQIEAAARLANAHNFIQALPEGYDTIVGERGATLSNGQRQRISIARAVIRNAPIVILDEPTTGLDEENERLVMEALERLIQGRTAFLITHRLSQARQADVVLVLEGGRIVEQGNPAELLDTGRVHRLLYRVHVDAEEAAQREPAAETRQAESALLTVPLPVTTSEPSLTVAGAVQPVVHNSSIAVSTSQRGGRLPRVAAIAAVAVITVVAAAAASVRATGQPDTPAVVPTAFATAVASTQPGVQPASLSIQPTDVPESRAVVSPTLIGGREVAVYSGPLTGSITLAWSPDNRMLALGSTDASVRLLDTATAGVRTLPGHSGTVYLLAWSRDGQTLATSGSDPTVRLWSTSGQPLDVLRGHTGNLSSVAWMPDGRTLASVSTDLKIMKWDGGRNTSRLEGPADFVTGMVWSPDGNLIASSQYDNSLRLWTSDGKILKTLSGHTDEVYCVAWSPDSRLLASGGNDNTVRVWNAQGDWLVTLKGHTAFVNSVAWSPEGRTLASGSGDGTIRLWTSTGAHVATLPGHTSAVLGVSWSPDGKRIAAVLGDSTVWIWNIQ